MLSFILTLPLLAVTGMSTRTATVDLHLQRHQPHDVRPLALTFTAEHAPESSEMPKIWQTVRHEVYNRMPHAASRGVSLILAPVVISSPDETTPGVGVVGEF